MHRTSTHVLVGLIAITASVSGVFAFSTRLSASTERLIAEVSELTPERALPVPEEQKAEEPPDIRAHLPLSATTVSKLGMPIAEAASRVTKKPFGIEIHPETSPVPNDRFDGFHVGVDFETFENEQEEAVTVSAICPGPLLFKKNARGYGGVAVQGCRINGEEVSVIYGHLRLESITPEFGEFLTAGQRIGELGKGHSEETDGVRKHLHLGIRKGLTNDIRGYVKDPLEMGEFLDALELLGLE